MSDWLGVLTVQDFVGLGTTQRSILADGFHAWSGDTNGIRRAGIDYVVHTGGGGQVEVLEQEQLQRCMDLAAKGENPPAEWLFIRDARSLVRSGQYRRAVLDAGAAAELAMIALNDKHLDDTNAEESVKKALAKRYRALEGNTELLRLLRPGLSWDQITDDLIKPRNTAGHGGDSLTIEQARKVVETAREIVEKAHPLA